MTAFLVFPLDEPIKAYTCFVSPMPMAWHVDEAESEEQAALAVHGCLGAPRWRYAVQGPAGVVLIDLRPVAGRDTLSLGDEGPHR